MADKATGKRGRPPSDSTKTWAVQARFDPEERLIFERLLFVRQEELRSEGVTLTASDLLRGLVFRDAAARGLMPKPQAEPEIVLPEPLAKRKDKVKAR